MADYSAKNIEQGISDKDYYLTFWRFEVGTPEAEDAWSKKLQLYAKNGSAPMVMGDIQPYQSQIDGSMIESRSKHRAHLKQHGCFEIGNETKYMNTKPLAPPPGLKQELIEQVNQKLRYK